MSSARNEILAAAGGVSTDPAAIAAAAVRLLDRVPVVRPDRVSGRPADAFLVRVSSPAVGATAERVASLADFPSAVRRYLAAWTLAPALALQPHPALRALDWTGMETRAAIGLDEPVAAGLALGAIAETGSLVFHSGPDAPTLFGFLPVHHIVAVEADRIWPWLEDYAAAFPPASLPRNVNLITGASGTTDIEGALVRGAHGPGHLHIVLVDPDPAPPNPTLPATTTAKNL